MSANRDTKEGGFTHAFAFEFWYQNKIQDLSVDILSCSKQIWGIVLAVERV